MHHYNASDMIDLLKRAYRGDSEASAAIQAITVPYAVAPDYSVLIVVQDKHATQDDNGLVRMLDKAPEEGSWRKQAADIYQCDEESASWGSVPIPSRFVIREVKYADGVFRFISDAGETVAGTPAQIIRAMLNVSYTFNGVPEDEIERCFQSIPKTVVPPRVPQKTAADNPPIQDELLGTITFDERWQLFEGAIQANLQKIEIMFNIDNREEVLTFLPAVRDVVSRLRDIDSTVKEFMADELLGHKNDDWLAEDEEPITRTEFIQRLSVKTLSFYEDGTFKIWYDDGDLFWGHSIMAHMNAEGEPENVDIHG